ncbi:MAG: transposase [Ignavibacteria bacterium]|nr:transposase [Ignavibacteria bacterium]
MANTFTQIYLHVIFSVKLREHLIGNDWKDELYKYINGIIQNKNQKLLIINGMPDHLHLLIGLKPDKALSDLVRDIKNNSTNLINEKRFVQGKFSWQEGFGAFSYSHSQLDTVINYIKNQELHHKKKSFREEYIELLNKFKIEFNEKYLPVFL